MLAAAAFAQALPVALGMIVATTPLVTVPLILVLRADRGPHHAFLGGWVSALAVVGAGAILLSDLSTAGTAPPARWIVALRLILGLALIALAARKWQRRGKSEKAPGWMTSLDTAGPRAMFGLGAALAALNPKNAVLAVAGALTIAAATPTPAAQAAAYAGFVAVASLGLLAPLLMTALLGARARAPLAAFRDWMAAHSDTILALVLLALGGLVAWKAFLDL